MLYEVITTFIGSHLISDLKISTTNRLQGIFGYSTGRIENLLSYNSSITAARDVGGIVGSNAGTVSNCANAVTISGEANVGGIAGNNTGTIEYCKNTAAITSTSSRIGGITGDDKGITKYCYNTGNISGNEYVGGIIGDIYNSTIECCYNTGDISATATVSHAGGIAGNSYDVNHLNNCYNIGNIICSGYDGGIVGYSDSGNQYTNCYYTGCFRGTQTQFAGISAFVPVLDKSTLVIGETATITGVTGVEELKPYFGTHFAISGTYALGTNADGKLTLSDSTITAVGVTEEYMLAPVKLTDITVTQNRLISTGYNSTLTETYTKTITEPSNAFISMPATYVTVVKADNPLQVRNNFV